VIAPLAISASQLRPGRLWSQHNECLLKFRRDLHHPIIGISLAASCDTMALVFRAFAKVLDEFQGEIDAGDWKYVFYQAKVAVSSSWG